MKHTYLVALIAVGTALISTSNAVSAEDFPDQELKIIVNYGEGGAVDRTARSIQKHLPDVIGQSVLVENISGASGKLGIEKFMAAEADGYTILTAFAPATTAIEHRVPEAFSSDDLAIINMQWADPAILVAHKDTGWTSLNDMVEAIVAEPGKYSFGSSGSTSVGHLLSSVLFDRLDLDVKIVPYKGGGKTRAAFQGGHVDMTAAGAGGALAIRDDAVVLGAFWPSAVEGWPEAEPLNELLAEYDVSVPEGGAYRFHAVHADVKANHPERFQALVNAFEEVTTEHSGFSSFAEETGVGTEWMGPDASTELLKAIDETFMGIIANDP